MAEYTCIICPKGCRLSVTDGHVSGAACPRGEDYARKESSHPTRTLTATVRLSGSGIKRLPVKTDREIPKDAMFAVMEKLKDVTVKVPVALGEPVLDLPDYTARVVATRSVDSL